MNPRCILALNSARQSAGGQPLTQAQINAIDQRISRTMRSLARRDPQAWMATPLDQRVLQAAQQAQADIVAEAQRKLANAQRQMLKTAELERRITDHQARQRGSTRTAALNGEFDRTEAYVDGVKRDATRHLMALFEAADSGQGASAGRRVLMTLFDAQNPAMTRDLALEVFSKGKAGTGNRLAKQGADAWLQVTEAMRQRFNAAGGDVGQLDYGYLPQAHDQGRVLATAPDAWAQKVLPLLDRGRYLQEDGSRMTDVQVLAMLRASHETISTGGLNKTKPGAFQGTGARANRGSESREIHFKDGQAYLAYQREFGTGSMYDAMIGHLGGLSRDIGLVERFGPNPETQMRLQFDLLARAGETPTGLGGQIADLAAGPAARWSVLSGKSGHAQYASVARIGQDVRNIEVFSKLQGATLSALTDLGTYAVTTGFNRLPYWQAVADIGRAMAPGTRRFLTSHGMIAESMISDLNRWSGDNIANNWSGKISNATMRLSLMNAWTDTLRRAFSLTMMRGLGKLADTEWSRLTEYDRWRMENKGLAEADWNLMRQARGNTPYGQMVTPDAVYATGDPRAGEVVAKMIGLITDESEIAVLNPDLMTRTIASGGGAARGSGAGELSRAVAQFKSFPIAMISRHWRRMMDTPQGMEGAPMVANRLAYAGALLFSMTALGAIAFQTKQIVQGKDPVDMTTPKFWSRAVAQGGGLGFVGDMLLTDTADDRSPMDSFSRAVMGPAYGSLADVYELTKGNIDEWKAGKNAQAGAEAIRFARGHTPLVNLWYAKAAIDHAGLHAAQENISPGYLARLRSRARKEWDQDYWWRPGTGLPERAPSFEDLAGP
jgi:hypothetical protein